MPLCRCATLVRTATVAGCPDHCFAAAICESDPLPLTSSSHSCGCFDCDCVAARESTNAANVEDFEFTFHYARYTYDTLIEEPTNEKLVPLLAPPASLSHSFILDLHLALGASHLAFLHPEKSPTYVGHAIRYQNRALEKFKHKLQGLPKPEECLPMFSFSATLGLLHLGKEKTRNDLGRETSADIICSPLAAFSRVPGPDGYPVDCLSTFIELGQLWRGCRSILAMSKEVLSSDVYLETFQDPAGADEFLQSSREGLHTPRSCQMSPGHEVLYEISMLESWVQEECEPGRLEVFQRSLKILRHISKFRDTTRPALMLAFSLACPEQYIELLRAGDSHARVILGLYAALLSRLDERWWSKGYAQDLMDELAVNPATERHAQMHQRWRVLLTELSASPVKRDWEQGLEEPRSAFR